MKIKDGKFCGSTSKDFVSNYEKIKWDIGNDLPQRHTTVESKDDIIKSLKAEIENLREDNLRLRSILKE